MSNISKAKSSLVETPKTQAGFTLIEAVIALVILMIVIAGVFAAFTYATTLNTGNSRRSQALSVLQKEVELLRSAKFVFGSTDTYTPTDCNDPRRNLSGTPDGTPRTMSCPAIDGMSYLIETEIDDDPFTNGQQIDATRHLKEIRVTVTQPARPGSWETAYVTRAVFRRVRAN